MPAYVDPIGLAKAILWEEAKGKLRAVAAASGQYHSGAAGAEYSKWEKVEKAVENFILSFEAEGYHE
jgi:hypothetical protein